MNCSPRIGDRNWIPSKKVHSTPSCLISVKRLDLNSCPYSKIFNRHNQGDRKRASGTPNGKPFDSTADPEQLNHPNPTSHGARTVYAAGKSQADWIPSGAPDNASRN